MMRKKIRKVFLIVFTTLIVLSGAFLIYTSIYYKAKDVDSYMESSDSVSVEVDNNTIAFIGGTTLLYDTIILYPGAKVEAKAYAPLARSLAELGNHVYIVRMPLRLAFLGGTRADKIRKMDSEKYSNAISSHLTSYYIAGHSLGGVAASSFVSKHSSEFEGLILLASYSTKDLSNTDLKVLSIYGSMDQVLNKKNYDEALTKLPKNTKEYVIEGGNHAYFASYGEQKGDGVATITREEQLLKVVLAVSAFVKL